MNSSAYSTVLVTGQDAREFLQGQLTQDIGLLERESRLLSAWCNPKGRVIALMEVVKVGEGFGLVLPTELAEDVVARLKMFRFRSKVELDIRPASNEEIGMAPEQDIDEWLLSRLRAGIPDIRQSQSEKFTPHMLNLDKLDAISFDKGCYTGQEIVARTEYRGASKRRMRRFECHGALEPGDKVVCDGRDVGEVLNATSSDALAIVPSAKLDQVLTVNDVPITHIPLAYLSGETAD